MYAEPSIQKMQAPLYNMYNGCALIMQKKKVPICLCLCREHWPNTASFYPSTAKPADRILQQEQNVLPKQLQSQQEVTIHSSLPRAMG